MMFNNVKTGDKLKLETESRDIEGIFLERPSDYNPGFVVIKLDSGYNIGVDIKKIKKVHIVSKAKTKDTKEKEVKLDKSKLTISILHTGGTIASKVDYKTGAVTASFGVDDLLGLAPELRDIANIRTELISNMMSEDMTFSDYKKMAKAIEKEIKDGTQGIIIGHGTDTLAVTAAALSFMFENLPVPVIIVGSQRSSDRPSTDAAMNLISAAKFITKTDFAGVAICMHKGTGDTVCSILPATKTKKLHTSRRDAFKPVNTTEIAEIDFSTGKIQYVHKEYPKRNEEPVALKPKLEEKVAVLRSYSNMKSDIIECLTKAGYKGIIFEGTGLGHIPANTKENEPNYLALKRFLESGGIAVMTSQCIYGRVHKFVYSNLRRLSNLGVVYGEDMLVDTAYVKLAWLLGNYEDPDEIKKLMTTNLRGEISERLTE